MLVPNFSSLTGRLRGIFFFQFIDILSVSYFQDSFFFIQKHKVLPHNIV